MDKKENIFRTLLIVVLSVLISAPIQSAIEYLFNSAIKPKYISISHESILKKYTEPVRKISPSNNTLYINYYSIISIINSKQIIEESDYVKSSPIKIIFSNNCKINSVKVESSYPANIREYINLKYIDNIIYIKPFTINPDDRIFLSVYTSECVPRIKSEYRIKGASSPVNKKVYDNHMGSIEDYLLLAFMMIILIPAAYKVNFIPYEITENKIYSTAVLLICGILFTYMLHKSASKEISNRIEINPNNNQYNYNYHHTIYDYLFYISAAFSIILFIIYLNRKK